MKDQPEPAAQALCDLEEIEMTEEDPKPSPTPHEGEYAPVEPVEPQPEDENGDPLDPSKQVKTGDSGHKGR